MTTLTYQWFFLFFNSNEMDFFGSLDANFKPDG